MNDFHHKVKHFNQNPLQETENEINKTSPSIEEIGNAPTKSLPIPYYQDTIKSFEDEQKLEELLPIDTIEPHPEKPRQNETNSLADWAEIPKWLWEKLIQQISEKATTEANVQTQDLPKIHGPRQDRIGPTRPLLEAPKPLSREEKAKMEKEMDVFVERMENLDTQDPQLRNADNHPTEAFIFALLIQGLIQQSQNKEMSALLLQQRIHDITKLNKQLVQERKSILDQVRDREKTTEILGWVDTTLFALSIFGMVLGGVLAIATGGASLTVTVAFAAVQATVSVTGGVTKITKGIMDYQNSKQEGELTMIRIERDENQVVIKTSLQDIKENLQAVTTDWSTMRNILKNWQNTITMSS